MDMNRATFITVFFLLAASIVWHGLNLLWIGDSGSLLGVAVLLYLPLGLLFFEALRRYSRLAGRGFPIWAALFFAVCHYGILLVLGLAVAEEGTWTRSMWDELAGAVTCVDMALLFFGMIVLSLAKGKKVP